MKIIKPYVEQISDPIDNDKFLKRIEMIGRTCYKSEENATDESAPEFVARLIRNGHEAMIEHAENISMKFVCDRGVSHEIVRHRLFSFAQESTRYCNYGDGHVTFILPCWFEDLYANSVQKILGIHELQDICGIPHQQIDPAQAWFWSMRSAELTYQQLVNLGWQPQQARSVLPNSLKTEIVVTGNLREWRHFFKLRLAKTAHPQMRKVAWLAYGILRDQVDVVFNNCVLSERAIMLHKQLDAIITGKVPVCKEMEDLIEWLGKKEVN